MQVFKKIYTLVLFGFLASCRSPIITTQSGLDDSVSEIDTINEADFNNSGNFRVGILLPLTGQSARYGKGLKNAALMALEDMNNKNLILQFYDTQSSPEGARVAAENAINQKTQMIVGPLTSTEVQAISYQTKAKGIPVVAFSTDSNVLQNQIYTLGLLVEEQVNRIVTYASQNGRKRFALLLPDNNTGIAVAKAAARAAAINDARVVKIAFYPPNSTDFSEIIRQLSGNGGKNAKNGSRNVDFDAVIIPESGARLKSAVAMFGYYDVFSPNVKFLGTSVWENTNLNKETTLKGSWYPAMSRNHNAYFNKKYNTLFGEYPQSLYAFAYDAVALSASLARQKPYNIDTAITNQDGFVGISGVFRILPDGKNEHSLDIMEISANGDIVVDLAAKKFTTAPIVADANEIATIYDANPPQIIGKDSSSAERQIFGRPLGYQYQNHDTAPSSQGYNFDYSF